MPYLNDAEEGALKLYAFGDDGAADNAIEPGDIQQRGLGDCYFLAVLSALAEYPHRIRALFEDQELNEYGLVACNVTKDGAKRQIYVDDYVPCTRSYPGA